MRLEEGKFYLGADGRKYGPMRLEDGSYNHPWEQEEGIEIWNDDGTSHYDVDLISEWTEDEPKKLTIARVEFNGGIGNARVFLSNGMELSGVTHIEAAAGVDEVTQVGIVANVAVVKKEPFSEYGNYGENNGPV